jgi:formylglycine-generating enzyme required for sulfatase activity
LKGYRLPTEAEWEYVCRAGTVTIRYYGLTAGLLPQYAWYVANGQNRTWPTASLEPNDSGLFDMLGNVWEWCFDLFVDYPPQPDKVVEDTPSTEPVQATDSRVMRGGAFTHPPAMVRSATRGSTLPGVRGSDIGFRPARTYP